jgi:methyltransferase (TIGR00027 family)
MSPQPKPNFTAWFVMQGTMAAMHHPDFRDSANDTTLALYQPLSNAASKTRFVSRIIHSLPYAWQYRIGELVTNPGRLRHFCFRKKEIEKQTRALLEGGSVKQAIILGAGLDVLSLKLAADYPAVKFIEIDLKESQEFKIASFRAHNIRLPDNLELLEGDLQNPLSEILATSRIYGNGGITLWIAEGLFMFLPEEGVTRILKEIRQISATGSPVIFTSLPSKRQGTLLGRSIQNFYLNKERIPFEWVLPFNNLPSFINNLGYQLTCHIGCDALHKNYMRQKFNGNHHFAEDIHIVTIIK